MNRFVSGFQTFWSFLGWRDSLRRFSMGVAGSCLAGEAKKKGTGLTPPHPPKWHAGRKRNSAGHKAPGTNNRLLW